jgi:hypothetical protein
MKKTWLEILIAMLKSRTVWSGMLSAIALIVYFKTGYFVGEVAENSPDVTGAIESVSLFFAVLGQIGIVVFRILATAGLEKQAQEAKELLEYASELATGKKEPSAEDLPEVIERVIEKLRKK